MSNDVKAERKPFATWEVGGETYKLKLRTQDITELEGKYKTNLMNVMGSNDAGMPALSVMLDVTRAALAKFHHGIGKKELADIFDDYIDEGGSQFDFYMDVYMNIFSASGFFSKSLSEEMTNALSEAKEQI